MWPVGICLRANAGPGPGGYARRMYAAPRPPLLKRVPLLGGQLSAGLRPEGGFKVKAQVPVPAAAR
jgi:hypothetical protein